MPSALRTYVLRTSDLVILNFKTNHHFELYYDESKQLIIKDVYHNPLNEIMRDLATEIGEKRQMLVELQELDLETLPHTVFLKPCINLQLLLLGTSCKEQYLITNLQLKLLLAILSPLIIQAALLPAITSYCKDGKTVLIVLWHSLLDEI